MSLTQLVSMIPEWLAMTAGREVSIGLSHEDAMRRASVMRTLLRNRTLDPDHVVLDDDLKAVFHALVALVTDVAPNPGRHLAAEVSAVFHFIRRVNWATDDLGERAALLSSCAERGWRALGIDIQDVGISRRKLEDGTLDTQGGCGEPSKYKKRILRTLKELQRERNSSPRLFEPKAIRIVERLVSAPAVTGFMDERDYSQGSAALSVSVSLRHSGRLDDSALWLDRARRSFENCTDSAPLLAVVGWARLSILFEREQFERALEGVPIIRQKLQATGMRRSSLKCDFLWAMCLNNLGRQNEAVRVLEGIRQSEDLAADAGLHGLILMRLADFVQSEGRFEAADELLANAANLIEDSGYVFGKADILLVLGDSLRRRGRLDEALSALARASLLFVELGMVKWLAFARLLLAETLLALSRPREAELEILRALPTIEQLGLVPDGLAAMALLRESVRQQKTNTDALGLLRSHLQRER